MFSFPNDIFIIVDDYRLAEYLSQKAVEANSEKSDFNFDGGLRVPYRLWKALYKYQKTGW